MTIAAGPAATLAITLGGKDSEETSGSLQLPAAAGGCSCRRLPAAVSAGGISFLVDPKMAGPSGAEVSIEPETAVSITARLRDNLVRQGATAWRGTLSVAAGGPAIPWLLAGRPAYDDAPQEPIDSAASHENAPLAVRLPWAVKETVARTFPDAFAEAIASATETSSRPLPDAVKQICQALRGFQAQIAASRSTRPSPSLDQPDNLSLVGCGISHASSPPSAIMLF